MRITGCIAAEKVANVIVPSENMTIPLTDPFLIWPVTWCANAPTAANPARSSAVQNPIRCSTSHATNSWKSRIAVAIGKDAPVIIETLTKGHS